jgi:hypothetical protein
MAAGADEGIDPSHDTAVRGRNRGIAEDDPRDEHRQRRSHGVQDTGH